MPSPGRGVVDDFRGRHLQSVSLILACATLGPLLAGRGREESAAKPQSTVGTHPPQRARTPQGFMARNLSSLRSALRFRIATTHRMRIAHPVVGIESSSFGTMASAPFGPQSHLINQFLEIARWETVDPGPSGKRLTWRLAFGVSWTDLARCRG
jgi:hypothetical protein